MAICKFLRADPVAHASDEALNHASTPCVLGGPPSHCYTRAPTLYSSVVQSVNHFLSAAPHQVVWLTTLYAAGVPVVKFLHQFRCCRQDTHELVKVDTEGAAVRKAYELVQLSAIQRQPIV